MAKKGVIGVDVGTSSCKCIVLDAEGNLLCSESRTYPLYQKEPGYSEQDPHDWWNAIQDCLRTLATNLSDVTIEGISFSGQMHGMVALDKDGKVIRNAILWNDQRTSAQCETITKIAGGLDGLLGYTNNQMLTGYTGGKILWMKENEPENYEKTTVVINPKDYIRYCLTGELCTDVSDASGFGLFNIKNRSWAYELIEKIGFKKEIFPNVVESTAQTGVILPEIAEKLGLAASIPVYGGGGDAVISTTGMGLVTPGKIGLTLGTSGVVAMGLPAYRENPNGVLQLFCNNKPGTWHVMGVTLAAAGSFQWFHDEFAQLEIAREKQGGENAFVALNHLCENINPGADGLIFLPYLSGERCPINDPKARAAFIGASSLHTRGHFTRAVLEGVAFSLKQVYDLIAKVDTNIISTEVIVSGGGAKSALWKQIIADIFQLPVKTVHGSTEGGAYGAALIGGTGCNLWNSLEDAMATAKPLLTTLPRAEYATMYEKQYRAYCKMYDALKWYYETL